MFHPQGPTFWELARQALSSTERGYDLLAPKFDFTPFRTPAFVLEAAAEVIRGRSPLDRAVDICCGTGAGLQMLRPLVKDEVLGIDISRGMLDVAETNSQEWTGEATARFLRADMLDPNGVGEPESCDAAVCFGALGHIRRHEEERFLANIRRLLRPGGAFYFATAEMPPWWSLSSLLARGFNAAMHVRNLLIRPPFIMFYLTFMLPEIQRSLEQAGFEVRIHEPAVEPRFRRLRIVEAIRVES